jgi:IS30 family transposase
MWIARTAGGRGRHGERYLSLPERQPIAALRRCGLGVRAIARELGRSPSTVSLELRRTRRPHDIGGYDSGLAHHRARERARRPRAGRLSRDPVLRTLVQAKLELEWSPEQIAAWLRREYRAGTTGTPATKPSTRPSITAAITV